MKVFYNLVKTVAITTWFLTIAQTIFLTIVKYKYFNDIKGVAAIGIIGGADGPTSIAVSTANKFLNCILPICPYIAVVTTVFLVIKRIRHNRTK